MRTSGALSYNPLDTLLISVTDYSRAVGSPDIPLYLYITDTDKGTNLINMNPWYSHILLIDWLVQTNDYFVFTPFKLISTGTKKGNLFYTSMLAGMK